VTVATDESYKDPTNLKAKLQKHQAFEAEITANEERIQTIAKVSDVHTHTEACTHAHTWLCAQREVVSTIKLLLLFVEWRGTNWEWSLCSR